MRTFPNLPLFPSLWAAPLPRCASISLKRTLPATFRELGPPDLCHVVKSTGRAGQREVSASTTSCPGYHSQSPSSAGGLVPLCLRRGRVVVRVARGVHQLSYVFHRRAPGVVHERCDVEGEKRLLLVRRSPPRMMVQPPAPTASWLLSLSLVLALLPAPPYLVRGPASFMPIVFSCFNAFSRVDVRVDVKIPGGVNAYVIDLRGERYVVPSPCPRPPDRWAPPEQTRSPRRNLARNISLRRPPRDPVLR